MNNKKPLTYKKLTSLIDYDPETGIFTAKTTTHHKRRAGEVITPLMNQGKTSCLINILGVPMSARRLAYFIVNKRWPKGRLVPADGDPTNLKMKNIVKVVKLDPAPAVKKQIKTCVIGIKVSIATGMFFVTINPDRKMIRIGSFETMREAVIARHEAEKEYKVGDYYFCGEPKADSAAYWLKKMGLLKDC